MTFIFPFHSKYRVGVNQTKAMGLFFLFWLVLARFGFAQEPGLPKAKHFLFPAIGVQVTKGLNYLPYGGTISLYMKNYGFLFNYQAKAFQSTGADMDKDPVARLNMDILTYDEALLVGDQLTGFQSYSTDKSDFMSLSLGLFAFKNLMLSGGLGIYRQTKSYKDFYQFYDPLHLVTPTGYYWTHGKTTRPSWVYSNSVVLGATLVTGARVTGSLFYYTNPSEISLSLGYAFGLAKK